MYKIFGQSILEHRNIKLLLQALSVGLTKIIKVHSSNSTTASIPNHETQEQNIQYTSRLFSPPFGWFRMKVTQEYTVEHTDMYYFKVIRAVHHVYKFRINIYIQNYTDLFKIPEVGEAGCVCGICKSSGDAAEMLLCDECNLGKHNHIEEIV